MWLCRWTKGLFSSFIPALYTMVMSWIVGIDEVGRGPLAGPVTVCALAMPRRYFAKLKGNFDSKKLSPTKREQIAKSLKAEAREGKVVFKIASVSAQTIDRRGIVFAVNLAIKRVLARHSFLPREVQIFLDGGLRAPKEYKNQKTIIRGDLSEPIIGLASVLAKVHRDKKMQRLDTRYPKWGFEIHKGYGTRAHYTALRKHGPSGIHRLSFIQDLLG